ncbi:D-hexose-6-phosphate mutarotase [Psychrobacter sp.]|uniref:D-hexose-6-phosphate mutarotase n=1 Tax=Psychrobacter sp. TaxID=56811 RepID=UPI0025E13EA4|nr:D-hexose-6-phosphate mutarotase [Psychrobacter sp.]
MLPTIAYSKIDELDAVTITSADYRATVLLQGAQLIHFSTRMNDDHNNWLWVSEKAEYKTGESVRGGIPICWPVFGQFSANPEAVQESFKDCKLDLKQHGFARTQNFNMVMFNPLHVDHQLQHYASLTLQLPELKDFHPKLSLQVKFLFNADHFHISLITTNHSKQTINFSQALHTYLPAIDITQSYIYGLSKVPYTDTLDKWETKTQQGNVTFSEGVDRIYHGAPNITLNTPAQTYHLQAKGSNSTVVWNPWIEKAKQVSQFAADDYQRMLCIETANAHLDSVTLEAGESHELRLTMCVLPF